MISGIRRPNRGGNLFSSSIWPKLMIEYFGLYYCKCCFGLVLGRGELT